MTTLIGIGTLLAYLSAALLFARRFYATYDWDYPDEKIAHSFASLALGLFWPIGLLVVAVAWQNPTRQQRRIEESNRMSEMANREARIKNMERGLGL